MQVFRLYLMLLIISLGSYTAIVGYSHGWSYMPTLVGDIMAMTWPGQFNVDFITYLSLSALWVAWRHRFSIPGLLLGFLAFNGAMLFFAPYLLIVSFQVKGDVRALLLGTAPLTPDEQ